MDSHLFYQRVTPQERALVTIVVMIGFFMAILDTTIVDIVVPKMMAPLSTDLYGIQWVITGYMMAAATALLFTENFARYIGYSWTFLFGMFLFTLSSLFCGLAQNLGQMILFRALQGIGEAFIAASAQTILVSVYPPEKRGLAMGIFGLGVSFAPALGPTLGGLITEYIDWRWIFFVNIPIGIINIIAGLFFLPKELGKTGTFQFNILSYLFIATATISLLIMLSKGQQLGWFQSDLILWLLFISTLSFIFYFFVELSSRNPLLDLSIYKIPEFGLPMGMHFFVLGFGMYQIFYLLPLYYENLKGLTTFQTGLHILVFAVFIGAFSIISGYLSDKLPPKALLLFSSILFLMTSYFLIPQLNYYTPAWKASLLTIPLGISMGTFFAPLTTLSLKRLGPLTGLGVVLMHYQRFVGGSFGTAIATNHLEFNSQLNFLRITELQNHDMANHFLRHLTPLADKLWPREIAEKKVEALLYYAQQVQALSWSFQETFRAVALWGLIGITFLLILFVIKPRG
ncbi:MAG: DHA2 family efflux MFS transporter permease subunit [Caldimicrobium sp.]|nr:DHA2 family efflux MFS transporter permease subunit [Caldimicrobium sp.]MCX7613780.1 DHA2 family efflux MFS transporter permease subunit [Caldimicrobium sp.]MDW8182607.1 DHA2 family efflux MFS transporter permease subunit [Caldimicrobium sp.]